MLDFFKCLIVLVALVVVVEYKYLDVNEKAHVASGTREKARLAPILIIGFISFFNVAVCGVFLQGDVMLLLQ